MVNLPSQNWNPTRLERVVEEPYDTSTGATKVKTDATFGYLKALGNRQGPHVLASEWVASSIARWFGMTLPDFAILPLLPEACFGLPRKAETKPGPAFVSRHVVGRTWGGSEAELRALVNPGDITRLVILDTWLRNCDRHPPDLATRKPNYANVYLADTDDPIRMKLIALDHTHCFNCGRDFSDQLGQISLVKDERTFGLFPAFKPFVSLWELAWCKAMLKSVDAKTITEIVQAVPAEWQVTDAAKAALISQICGRAGFIADRIEAGWVPSN